MNKTYLAVLIGSLFVSATPAFADDVVYLQNGALDAAVSEDTTSLEFDVSSDNTIVMSADDGEEHVVSAADSFTIHHDAPRNSGSFIAKNGSTLTLSADTIALSLDHDVTDPWPNLVHAYGGTVNIEGGSSVTLTSTATAARS